MDNAQHTAMTVEMADTGQKYDAAVIDEIQVCAGTLWVQTAMAGQEMGKVIQFVSGASFASIGTVKATCGLFRTCFWSLLLPSYMRF